MSNMVRKLEMHENNRIPDHSLLTWTIPLFSNDNGGLRASIHAQNEQTHVSQVVHKTSEIPNTFLNEGSIIPLSNGTLQKI